MSSSDRNCSQSPLGSSLLTTNYRMRNEVKESRQVGIQTTPHAGSSAQIGVHVGINTPRVQCPKVCTSYADYLRRREQH